jgi:hypothetical protein
LPTLGTTARSDLRQARQLGKQAGKAPALACVCVPKDRGSARPRLDGPTLDYTSSHDGR